MHHFFLQGNSRIYQRMGFYDDQEGIVRRYAREAMHWNAHLGNTKSCIVDVAAGMQKGKVAVLGSGWLLDVPCRALSAMFGEVWLFDIRHPEKVKRQLREFTNIRLVETDISGFAVPIYEYVDHKAYKRSPIQEGVQMPRFDFDLKEFDYVVSCNILNQLDILLIDYLRKYVKVADEDERFLRKLVQDTHIGLLPVSKSCLVSDVEELWMDKHEGITDRHSLVFSDRMPKDTAREWIWKFDNHRRYDERHDTWFRVEGRKV